MGKVRVAENYLTRNEMDIVNELLERDCTIDELVEKFNVPRFIINKSLSKIHKYIPLHIHEGKVHLLDRRYATDVFTNILLISAFYMVTIAYLI